MLYNDFFGFQESPFNVTSDPQFLFMSNVHKEAFSHMIYGIEYRKGFITITGEIGTGKTTLCRALISKLDQNIKSALILNPCLTSTQILRAVVEDLGIEPSKNDKITLLKELNTFLMNELHKGNNVVVIIDEAQNLSASAMEQIRLLSNLETEKEKLLQIILCGQPELISKLNSHKLRQLKQRIAVKYHITALREEETAEYIRFRIKRAARTSDKSPHFTDKAIEKIYEYTHGTPRLINLLCDKVLLLAFVETQKELTDVMVANAHKELETIVI